MAFRLDPPQSTQFQIQHLAVDRIDSALAHLSKIDTVASNPTGEGGEKDPNAARVHAVRRRCKQARALARLVKPALGADFAPFNTDVRDAARALASLRNAHVSEQLLEALDAAAGVEGTALTSVSNQPDIAAAVETARRHLRSARGLIEGWQLPDGFDPLASGLERTYRRGRRGLAATRIEPTAETLHEWRKDVKDLWYQLRLVERISPSMLGPLINQLDDLGEDLGHHHDITLLIDGLDRERRSILTREGKHAGAVPDAKRALADIQLAEDRADDAQRHLGIAAARAGATVYAETPDAFVARITAYWDITARYGPEPA